MSEATNEQRRMLLQPLRRLAGPFAVLAGGLLGSGMRAAVATMSTTGAGGFPVTTLVVNLVGSLLLGFYLARRQRAIAARWSLQFWAIGGLGSFTTFSAFSAEVFRLVASRDMLVAVSYVTISILGGLAAALLGRRLGAVGR